MQNTSPQSLSLFKNDKAQITISKAWKKYKNLKTYKKCKENLPEYHESLKKWDTSIIQPVVTDIPPTPKRSDVLAKIPDNIRKYYHIASHDTFLHHLNKSWDMALNVIKDKPYHLLCVSLSDKIKSEHWVAGSLLQHNPTFQPLPPPKRQCDSQHDIFYDIDCSNVIPEPKHYVVVDDAAYTGNQIYWNLKNIIPQLSEKKNTPVNIHVVIPFTSNDARKQIQSIVGKDEQITLSLYSSAIIIHTDEQKVSMSDTEKKYADFNCLQYMTIFSHKQADDISLGKAAKEHQGSVALYAQPETRKTFIAYLEEQKNKNQL